MKKLSLQLCMILLSVILLSACKKDYTCKCTVSVDVPGFGVTSEDTTFIFEDVTKKDAKKSCDFWDGQFSTQAAVIGGTGGCEL